MMTQLLDKPDAGDRPGATVPRRAMYDSYNLVLVWCLFLIGSWSVTLRYGGPRSGARLMLYAGLIGLTALWPAVRLSQQHDRLRVDGGPLGLLLRDWVCLNVVIQAVVWPLKVNAHWSVHQTLYFIAALGAWSLLAGAIVGWGLLYGKRTAAMVVCMGVLFAEPGAVAFLALTPPGGSHWLSPIGVLWQVVRPLGAIQWGGHVVQVVGVGAVALLAWVVLFRLACAVDPRPKVHKAV